MDRALHWYEHMTQAHIEADFITYRFAPDASIPLSTALMAYSLGHAGSTSMIHRLLPAIWEVYCLCISLPCT